mmetsp:Transcript_22165/g.37721  ORF Transcript_22165/g.37721 Transcript_22165/m.37721 type:complete len:175 (-) Transcript_22165:1013-1537(-)
MYHHLFLLFALLAGAGTFQSSPQVLRDTTSARRSLFCNDEPLDTIAVAADDADEVSVISASTISRSTFLTTGFSLLAVGAFVEEAKADWIGRKDYCLKFEIVKTGKCICNHYFNFYDFVNSYHKACGSQCYGQLFNSGISVQGPKKGNCDNWPDCGDCDRNVQCIAYPRCVISL